MLEVYAVRDAYAAEHEYDLDRIYADLKRREVNSSLHRADTQPQVQTTQHLESPMASTQLNMW